MSPKAITKNNGAQAVGLPMTQRAPRISQADVFRAADELLVEGHRPTIDRVRMRLRRGSPNTIHDLSCVRTGCGGGREANRAC